MQLGLFGTKNAKARNSYIKSNCTKGICIKRICLKSASIRVICIGSTYFSNICARGICARNVFSAINTCIKTAGHQNTYLKDIGKESTCIGGAGAVKHSKIHFQSFLILEVELFRTGLMTGVRVG